MNKPNYEAYTDRMKSDWEKVTKEPIEVHYCKGNYDAYGSELAALRLFHHYNQYSDNSETQRARMGYSENLKTWYFTLEL